MTISTDEVKRIAKLACLAIPEQELAEHAQHLGAILALAEQLGSVDTTGVAPLAHPIESNQRLRPDEVTEYDQHELFQRIAPAVAAGLYLVPQVIEHTDEAAQ